MRILTHIHPSNRPERRSIGALVAPGNWPDPPWDRPTGRMSVAVGADTAPDATVL